MRFTSCGCGLVEVCDCCGFNQEDFGDEDDDDLYIPNDHGPGPVGESKGSREGP